MKKNKVFNDLVEAGNQALSHAKGEKEFKETKVISLFNEKELDFILDSLYNLELSLIGCMTDTKINKIEFQKLINKGKKLQEKIIKILENHIIM